MKKPFVFEVSWEVCNKVGGIHTVLESKAEYIKAQYGEGYFLVGPYLGQSSEIVFEAKEMPDFLKSIVKELENLGIRLFYGTWLIDAEPQVILVDFTGETANINQTKTKLWDWYQVDSLNSDFEFDEPVAWSFAVGKMIEALKKGPLAKEEIVLQCHEWMAGAPILYLKKQDVKISSIFTTHATFMGRVLASKGVDFYKSLNEIDAESKAYEFGIYAKFLLEKAIALNATVLTTVSDITASEAK
ncbi:MAG: Glycogen phosphorylase, partial [candidate division CPR2 bacterium GW2011_GWD1_39_7]